MINKTLTANEIKATFPFPRFGSIVGKPAYAILKEIETQATQNTQMIDSGMIAPHINLLGLIEKLSV